MRAVHSTRLDPEIRGFLARRRRAVDRLRLRGSELVERFPPGIRASPFRGPGVEAAGVREYRPGDDVRWIDWRVTARRGAPHVKEFVAERELTTLLVVDRSASLRALMGWRKEALALETAALLAFAADRVGEPVGLLTWSERLESFVPPVRRGGAAVVATLLSHRPAGWGTDLPAALRFAASVPGRPGLLVVISDFEVSDDGRGALEQALREARSRRNVLALRVMGAEAEAPRLSGTLRVRGMEGGVREVLLLEDLVRAERARAAWPRVEDEMARLLRASGVPLADLRVGHDPLPVLVRFLGGRGGGGGG